MIAHSRSSALDTTDGRNNAFEAAEGILGDLVLPNSDYSPSTAAEFAIIPSVASAIPCDLRFPVWCELVPPLREAPTMPEVAIDEHGHLRAPEH
jgi:hypothetical protein